ncbi:MULTISPECIES: A/G-specific adenine glycosylase [unclassified Virgibacillus]|uniref:A/G-specific adenine glycosylase n=1 Tax=unclassified Virgibacillus TaxID=2620237 RepID=UPI0024DEE9E6|nr:A/G-specific adenine glycosylase [Virgibacillus sp. LDC-1]
MADQALQNINILQLQNDLIQWYTQNKRDLPWRKDQDPYKIWVSEIMLQQTKVDTVIPYFNRFIQQFPTVFELANADEQEVLKAWEGLGYYSRARNLQTAVKEVVASYGGNVPADATQLGTLKGIGPYTKGAILSIAFQQPEPAVDGNVMRVITRILNIDDDIAQAKTRKRIEAIVRELISQEDPSAFNQGIMELGALICTPKSPACMLCPVQSHCQAFAEGVEEQLPVKAKAKKQKRMSYMALLIRTPEDKIMIEKRPENGLLANLWQFPMVLIEEIGLDHVENWLQVEYGVNIKQKQKCGKLKHVFSHIIWEIDIYLAETDQTLVDDQRLLLLDKAELTSYPFPVSHQKMMAYL